MKEVRYYILLYLFCSICIVFSSCDPSSTYVYTIYNNSTEPLKISLNNPSLNEDSDEESINGCNVYHSIKINEVSSISDEHPVVEVELKSYEKLTFVEYVCMSSHIQANPERESHVVWGPYSCIIHMQRNTNILAESNWRERKNWKKVKEKKRFVEFLLFVE